MNQYLTSVHVLVVADSADIREIVIQALEWQGATVTGVSTAEHALALLEQSRPRVLISDLEMLDKDGYWLIGQVRALAPERGGLTPAACLTERTDPEHRARALRAGFQYHIAKPVDVSRLLGIVAILALKP
jgi:CheY-like chemotaxis protein